MPLALTGRRLKNLRNVVLHLLHAKLCPQELSQVMDDLAHAPLPAHAPTSCAVLEQWHLKHSVPVAGYEHGHPHAVRVRDIVKQAVADNPRINSAPCWPAAVAGAAAHWPGGVGCSGGPSAAGAAAHWPGGTGRSGGLAAGLWWP
jgi:hypothetical protein